MMYKSLYTEHGQNTIDVSASIAEPKPVPKTARFGSLEQLMIAFGLLYVLTLMALRFIDLKPGLPWDLVLLLPVVGTPFGMVLFIYSQKGQTELFLDVLVGVVILFTIHYLLLWIVIGVLLLLSPRARAIRWHWDLGFKALAVLALGYATLWNINYLLAHFRPEVKDASLRTVDVWFYSQLLGEIVPYTKLFPVIRNDSLTHLLNNAYSILFPELFLVLILSCQAGVERVVWFLKNLFCLQVIGVTAFLIYPAIGPCLYYPESLDIARNVKLKFVSEMWRDYQMAISSGGNLKGYGYFIALPSLHVLQSMFLQYSLVRTQALFWVFLPINVTLILSTFLLGYHYVLDVVAAMLLGGVWIYFQRFTSARRASCSRTMSNSKPTASLIRTRRWFMLFSKR